MNQPTKEQIQWFWEQCADKVEHFCGDKHRHYHFGDEWEEDEPPIDLNRLFRYAVPKLGYKEILLVPRPTVEESWSCWIGRFRIGQGTMPESVVEGEDTPALALFWAIYKAFGGS